jgi:hypothetical protein
MGIRLFVMLFCASILSGQVFAQRNWEYVTSSRYIDPDIKRLPNGNIVFWVKWEAGLSGTFISQKEVNCVAKEQRQLSMKVIDGKDSYGNTVPAVRNVGTMGQIDVWSSIPETSTSEIIASFACRSAKDVTVQANKPTTKKKVVTRKPKRKS